MLMAPLAMLYACGPNDASPGPGGVTIGDARKLDEAAALIEQRAQAAGAFDGTDIDASGNGDNNRDAAQAATAKPADPAPDETAISAGP